MTLPPHLDWALREIGVMPSPPPAKPKVERTYGVWYKDGEIPH